MRRVWYAIIALVLVALAVPYFVPLISERIVICPPNSNCPIYYSQDEWAVSVTYHVLGVGGRLGEGHYQIAYLPGWTCRQAPSGATATVTLTNGTWTTTRVVSSMPGIECTANVIAVT